MQSTGCILGGTPPNSYYPISGPSYPMSRSGPLITRSNYNLTDSLQGPSFEGAHPPTLGPQSSGNSFEEAMPYEDSASHHADHSDECSSNDFFSDPPSRAFSRGDSSTHLEIDSILRDSGCDSPQHPVQRDTAADLRQGNEGFGSDYLLFTRARANTHTGSSKLTISTTNTPAHTHTCTSVNSAIESYDELC